MGRDEKVSLMSTMKTSVVNVDHEKLRFSTGRRRPDWAFLLVDIDQTEVLMVDVDQENLSLVWTLPLWLCLVLKLCVVG